MLAEGGDEVVVSGGCEVEGGGSHVVNLDGAVLRAVVEFLLLDDQDVVRTRAIRENCAQEHENSSKRIGVDDNQ